MLPAEGIKNLPNTYGITPTYGFRLRTIDLMRPGKFS